MGNRFVITVAESDEVIAEQHIDFAVEEIRRIEKLLTTFSNESQTFQINENAGIQSVKVDDEVFALIERAQRISDLTEIKKIPTLVLWGENDELFPKAEGMKFANAVNAEFVSIPNCGHAAQMDAHDAFLNALNEFINGINRQD